MTWPRTSPAASPVAGVHRREGRRAAGAGVPAHGADRDGRVARPQGPASTRATPHRGVAGDRVGREREGRANARAQVRDHDARPVWAPVPEPVSYTHLRAHETV